MSLWNKLKEATGATAAKVGNKPFSAAYSPRQKRNIVATSVGWIRREYRNDRHGKPGREEEILVTGHFVGTAASGKLSFPDISDIYVSSNSTHGTKLTKNTLINVYVVFNEPVFHQGASPGKIKLLIANTVSGNACVAVCNTVNSNNGILNANNTLVFRVKLPNTAGLATYKVQAQTLANSSATAVSLKSLNSGNRSANLVLGGSVSNTMGTFQAR